MLTARNTTKKKKKTSVKFITVSCMIVTVYDPVLHRRRRQLHDGDECTRVPYNTEDTSLCNNEY